MKPALLTAAALTMLLLGCSSPAELSGRWRTAAADARQAGSYFIKDQNISVSVENDAEYLYLSVGVGDRMKQRQILFRGLTVWFDRKGGDERRFGIEYPLPSVEFPRGERRRLDGERTPDTSWIFPENISSEIEILGPGDGEHRRMQLAETRGITAALEHQGGTLFYTLRIPLNDSGEHLYGIGATPGSTVGIGIESGGSMRPAGDERGGGMSSGMPGGGLGRGRRGGGFGGGADGFRSAPEPIKFWGSVRLATPGGAN